jgi:hypothetical protein
MSLSTSSPDALRVAILGAGGLGRGMAKQLLARQGFMCAGMVDSSGFWLNTGELTDELLSSPLPLAEWPNGVACTNPIETFMADYGAALDAVFMALPNLPVTFYADTLAMIAERTPFQGVMVDALKRTQAVELLAHLHNTLENKGILYITGAGATPGFLTTIAAVAAQSFIEVLSVNIHFGVGVANWEAYRATIREDFLHLPSFNAERVAAMTDADIEAELNARNGRLELVNMEHADDIILELAGICPRDRVTVGGVVDTRSATKPVSTTVTVVGRTLAGEVTQHLFTVGDATTMVDNVCGPACGFMASGVNLYNQGQFGLLTSAQVMPLCRVPSLELVRPTIGHHQVTTAFYM